MATVTRTVVFTDLVNYTEKTARSDRETLRRLISRHEEWTREICEPLGGRLVKGLGDAFITLFDSATDALRACLRLAESGLPGTGFSLRASAATGDVEEIEGDIFGEAVNMAARLSDMTPGGEVWFTESTRRCANLAEVPWEAVGIFAFKGIPEKTPCFRAPTPSHCVPPSPVAEAARKDQLLRIRPGSPPPPRILPGTVVLFEGFQAGSTELANALNALPVLDPAQLWLLAYTLPPLERQRWAEEGRGLVIGMAAAFDVALDRLRRSWSEDSGKATVFIDVGSDVVLELVLAGLALPVVPLGGVVAGYSYDLLPDGRWDNSSPDALVRVDVSNVGVTLHILSGGSSLDGRTVVPGTSSLLRGGEVLQTAVGELRFYDLSAEEDAPYLGMLVGDSTTRLSVAHGERAELGRNPSYPGIALPDRQGQTNLRWCSGDRARRTRTAGFTLDRALVGRQQAAVTVSHGGGITVEALHSRLATYTFRPPDRLLKLDQPEEALIGDILVMGTNLVALRSPTP